ncbi:MAG TPA: helix-turn-helix domain-containing protein [Terriglobales bacterium]|jgi:excisionase family DNA binding protein|nr:helix-turn-helix domain-containing protein [Terriglobales bacterium]
MNQGITDEGTPELGARMTSDSRESNPTAGDSSGKVLLTADEVAQILRVPRSWVYSHLSELPVIRLGRYVRFRRSEIDGFLEKRGPCQ